MDIEKLDVQKTIRIFGKEMFVKKMEADIFHVMHKVNEIIDWINKHSEKKIKEQTL